MKEKKQKNIFGPTIKKNSDYVGNIKANYKSIEYKQLTKFLKTYFENYIITVEDYRTEKEYCHFWAQNCKLKSATNNQRTTLANYFRRDLPTLKRDGKGGTNKYNLKIMKEDYQFYYIFKDQDKTSIGFGSTGKTLQTLKANNHIINIELFETYQKFYKILNQAKKRGKWGEFLQYCIDKYGAENFRLKRRNLLIEDYMDWADVAGACPTINLCDRYVNGVLLKYSKDWLTQDFKNIINNKYNKEYF